MRQLLADIAQVRWAKKNRFPKRAPAGSIQILNWGTTLEQYMYDDGSVLEFSLQDGQVRVTSFYSGSLIP